MEDVWKKTIVTCNYCGKPLPRADVICKGKRLALCADCLSKAISLLADYNAKSNIQKEYQDEVARRSFGKRDWRNEPMTEKQREFINTVKNDFKDFHGKTKGEACDYIDEFMEYDKRRREEESWEAEAMWDSLHGDWGDRQ